MIDLRQDAVALLEASGRGFESRISSLPGDRWSAPGPEGGWSVAQVAEHVTLVEVGVEKVFRKRLFQVPADPDLLRATVGKDDYLRSFQGDRVTRRTAPDFVNPRGTWTGQDEVLEVFWEARSGTIDHIRHAPVELRAFGALHPILGPLDAYQWVLFLGLHLERHLIQIEGLLSRG